MKGMKFGSKNQWKSWFSLQQEMSVSTKVSKQIVPFQQEFPI